MSASLHTAPARHGWHCIPEAGARQTDGLRCNMRAWPESSAPTRLAGRHFQQQPPSLHHQSAITVWSDTQSSVCSQKKRKNDFTCATSLQPLMSLWVLTAALQQHQSIPGCAWWSAFQISSSKSTNLLYVMLIPVFKLSFCYQTRITTSSSFHDCRELKEGSSSPATTCVNMRFGDMGTCQVLGTENSLKHAAC